MLDLIVKNCRIITPTGVVNGALAIAEGKIAKLGKEADFSDAKMVIDAKENWVAPGLIDPHVHLGPSLYGLSSEEYLEKLGNDFQTETLAALFGGITTVLSFFPVVSKYEEMIDATKRVGETNSFIDFGYHFMIDGRQNISDVSKILQQGGSSFKFFYNAYKGKKGHILGYPSTNETQLYKFFKVIAKQKNILALVHAEDEEIIKILSSQLKKAGRNDLAAWTESRPNSCEYIKVLSALEIAKVTGAKIYFVHVSTSESIEAIQLASESGLEIYAETCPHYLTLDQSLEKSIGNWGKVNPPLRDGHQQEALWNAIKKGYIKHIGSDNCPRDKITKEQGAQFGNIWAAPPGFANGMEDLLPILMTEGVNKKKIDMKDLVKICSENNAKRFGLYPRKGNLLPGADADVIIVDANKEVKVEKHFYHGIGKEWSPYFGRTFKGIVEHTIVGGRLVMSGRKVIEEPGRGRYLG